MMREYRAINYRKYLLLSILIYLVIVICVDLLQELKRCRNVENGDRIRVSKRLIAIADGQKIQKDTVSITFFDKKTKETVFSGAALGKIVYFEGEAIKDKGNKPKTSSNSSIKGSTVNSIAAEVTETVNCRIKLIDPEISTDERSTHSGYYFLSLFIKKTTDLQRFFVKKFNIFLPPVEASLASGILLGVNQDISEQIHQEFVQTGLLHVVAASGYNIQIVVQCTTALLLYFFPKKTAELFSTIAIVVYVILAGMSPAIIRAGLMGGILIFSGYTGRVYLAGWGLLATVLIMLWFSPFLLLSVSFQLSVGATMGILAFVPLLKRKQQQLHSNGKHFFAVMRSEIKEAFYTTFAASLLTYPILLFWFGQLSVVGIFANVALLWMIPWMMGVAAIVLMTACVVPFAAPLIAIPFIVLTRTFLFVVHLFALIPFSMYQFEHISPIVVLCWYLGVLILYVFLRRKRKKEESYA